jgi:hypothetical protein
MKNIFNGDAEECTKQITIEYDGELLGAVTKFQFLEGVLEELLIDDGGVSFVNYNSLITHFRSREGCREVGKWKFTLEDLDSELLAMDIVKNYENLH